MRRCQPPRTSVLRAPTRGYTLLELLIAMSIFAILGTSAVVMMRQGATLFSAGTRENELSDRGDTLLPPILADLARLQIPDAFDPVPPPPTAEQLGSSRPPPLPPPVVQQLRSGLLKLREAADTNLRSFPCPWFAFVVSTGDEGHDARLRRAGDPPAAGDAPKPYVKAEVDKAGRDTIFRATGGAMEVCYICVPLDPAHPAILTMFRGYRAPVGGAESLLDPANFDTLTKIRQRFDLRHQGLLYLGVTWRRANASSWDAAAGRGAGSDLPYVGPVWDSTRGYDKDWPLFREAASVRDPSDDLFPQYVRLEATIAAAGISGYGRGDTRLVSPIGADDTALEVESVTALLGPGPDDALLKVGMEWMGYRKSRVDADKRKVPVERAQRGSAKGAADAGADVYAGQTVRTVMPLPVWRDQTMRKVGR